MQLTPEVEGLNPLHCPFQILITSLPPSDTEKWEESSFQELTVTSDEESKPQGVAGSEAGFAALPSHTVEVHWAHELKLIFPVTFNQQGNNIWLGFHLNMMSDF